MNIISRVDAKVQGLQWYYTAVPCANDHMSERSVATGKCRECNRQKSYRFHVENKDRRNREWRENYSRLSPSEKSKKEALWRARNPEAVKRKNRQNKARYQEKRAAMSPAEREAESEKIKAWRRKNPEKVKEAARKFRKTPLGRLRRKCKSASKRLGLGELPFSKLSLLDYSVEDYRRHLDNKSEGDHEDHIVSLAVISAALPMDKAGRLLAFKVAQDLENLQWLPGPENISKGKKVCRTAEEERVLHYLGEKYGVTDLLLNVVLPL